MFFFFGIMNDQKDLHYHQPMTCAQCGRMGQYQVFMTYMVLSIFFIPIFKWGRTYYVRTSCCDSLYQLRPELGRAIERGEQVTIHETDLYLEQQGQGNAGGRSGGFSFGMDASGTQPANGTTGQRTTSLDPRLQAQQGKWTKVCYNCGYTTTEDFEYCPKCGKKFEYSEEK